MKLISKWILTSLFWCILPPISESLWLIFDSSLLSHAWSQLSSICAAFQSFMDVSLISIQSQNSNLDAQYL